MMAEVNGLACHIKKVLEGSEELSNSKGRNYERLELK